MKKFLLMFMIMCLCGSMMNVQVYAKERVKAKNNNFDISYYSNAQENRTIVEDLSTGFTSTAILDKSTNQLMVDGDEVDYKVYRAQDAKQENIILPQSADNWTPVLVAKGLNFNMSTLFKSTASVISGMLTLMGYLQLYFGQPDVKYIISDVIGKAAVKVGSKINVKYAYDWYRTAGRVLLPGATIKTVASRYQNYRVYLIYGKKTFSTVTSKKGKWWSGQKPY